MMGTLQNAKATLRRGDPLPLDHVTDLMQRGVDVHALEQDCEREELPGSHIIDERDFTGDYSEDRDFQQPLMKRMNQTL